MIDEKTISAIARKENCELELFKQLEESVVFSSDGPRVHSKNHSKTAGYAVRAIKDRKMGFYSFEKEAELGSAATKAIGLSKFQEKAGYYFQKNSGKSSRYLDKRAADFEATAIEALTEMLSSFEKSGAKSVQNMIGSSMNTDWLVNSEGADIEQKSSAFFSASQAVFGKTEGDYSESSASYNFSPTEVARNAATNAIDSANSKNIRGGKAEVIFSHHALQELFSLFIPYNFNGESLRKKLTKLSRGTKFAPENISIIDNPKIIEGLKPSEYDDEGFSMAERALVREGLVSDFLFDMQTSVKMKGEKPGNGLRNSYHFAPNIGFSDIEVRGGDVSDVLSECKDGIFVDSFLTSGANSVTGDFSFPLLIAFKISSGEKKFPIKNAMIKGNFFSVMKMAAFERKPEVRNGLKSGRMKTELEIIS